MNTTRYYALSAYGFPGHPFPKFYDSYATMAQARRDADALVRDGWRYVEILRDAVKPAGYVGIPRDIVATVGAP